MTNDDPKSSNSDKLIRDLGKVIAEKFEDAISDLDVFERGGDGFQVATLRKYAGPWEPFNASQKIIVQLILEGFIHGVLYRLGNEKRLKIMGLQEDGKWIDLDNASEAGLHGEYDDWLREFSKFGCKTMDLVDFDLKSSS